jgi:hydrogenase maturation protease
MNESILVAGIGNIFHRDDGFGVYTVSRLARRSLPGNVRAVDFGIRGIDLAFALMDGHGATIFVDAISRGGNPGTLYKIEPDLDEFGNGSGGMLENAHGLDPLSVLRLARKLGASIGRVFVVGCEPATVEEDSGEIGLSKEVEASIEPAMEMIRSLVDQLNENWMSVGVHVERTG